MTNNIKTWPKSSLTDDELLDNYWNQDHNDGTKLADDLRPVANANYGQVQAIIAEFLCSTKSKYD